MDDHRLPQEDREKSQLKTFVAQIAAMKENDQELIAATIGSPLNREIREARLSERFKLLAIKAYEGKSDP